MSFRIPRTVAVLAAACSFLTARAADFSFTADGANINSSLFFGDLGWSFTGSLLSPSGSPALIGADPLNINLSLTQPVTTGGGAAGGYTLMAFGMAGLDPKVPAPILGSSDYGITFPAFEFSIVLKNGGVQVGGPDGFLRDNPFDMPVDNITTYFGSWVPAGVVFDEVNIQVTNPVERSASEFTVGVFTSAANPQPVPDGGATLSLLAGAAFGLVLLRRNRRGA